MPVSSPYVDYGDDSGFFFELQNVWKSAGFPLFCKKIGDSQKKWFCDVRQAVS